MIKFTGVTKSYDGGASYIVKGLNLHIKPGELLVILGESGCGKTTTLKMINRLTEPSDGQVEVNGKDIADANTIELRRHTGYVFQGVGLFHHITVGENIAVVPKLLGWRKNKIRQRVEELLTLVHLDPAKFTDRFPRQLSGGQAQRVGVARALAAYPKIMLMDEPFGALDPLTRENLQEEYCRIHAELKLTTVMVTHDILEALSMGDRIAIMEHGQMVQQGTPGELLGNPANDYVKQLMHIPRRQTQEIIALLRSRNL